MKKEYIPRIIDSYINESLKYSGAILIEGAKGCGKTRTAKERSKSAVLMQDPEKSESYLKIAATKPALLLKGETPRLIDEWQLAPMLWNGVKFLVDERGEPGQFILTGSASPPPDDTRHSGAGRFSRILMRPMSLFESGESNGMISLRQLFDHSADVGGISELSVEDMVSAIIRGGWPITIGEDERFATVFVKNYVDAVINVDISSADGIKRNPVALFQLFRSLSRNISTTASMSTLQRDMGEGINISDKTIVTYLDALRRIYVIEDLPAWNPSLRSSVAIRTSPKRHFVDPSIATSVLRADKGNLLMDFNTLGFLFESLCIRDLRVYAQTLDGDVFHYRDANGLEIDAIIHLRDGRWGAIEIKMGTNEIDKASRNLLKLKDYVDIDRMSPPSFLMVLTAGEFAYQMENGVMVIPIGCLKD